MVIDRKDSDSKFAVLAGAGSTNGLGYPTFEEYLLFSTMAGNDESGMLIKNTYIELKYKKRKNAVFEAVIGELQGYLEIAHELCTDRVLKEFCQPNQNIIDGKVKSKFNKALLKCYRILMDSYGPKAIDRESSAFKEFPKLLKKAAMENGNSIDIYTTNYDCSYQVLASNNNKISFYSHISNEDADDGLFKDDLWYSARTDLLDEEVLPKIFIHRLHGCITWSKTQDDSNDPGNAREIFGSGDINDPPLTDDELNKMCIKLIFSLLPGTNRVFRSAFNEFQQHLKKIKTLLVWGYSFRDLEVTRMINEALKSRGNDPFEIHYIDPYLTEARASEYIKNTLGDVPFEQAEHFTPKRVDWIPSDGYKVLTNKILKIIKEAQE